MAQLHPWFGFLAASLATSRGMLDILSSAFNGQVQEHAVSSDHPREWATSNVLLRKLTTMRVLDFSTGQDGAAAIIVAPFALHAATTADFARSHSVVEALLRAGITRIVLTDWRSADPCDRYLSIDSYLADLNVVIDDFGTPAALVGICQGGWLAAAYTARFPAKVSRLVLAGAPIDIAASNSTIAQINHATAPEAISELVDIGGGLLLGKLMMSIWPTANPTARDIAETLQLDARGDKRWGAAAHDRFLKWHMDVVDLPGVFYRQVTEWIFRENRLARGEFVALGKRISLADVSCPLFMLAARNDEIIDAAQLCALAGLVSTPPDQITSRVVDGRHLSLFMGRRTLRQTWPEIAAFLSRDACNAPAAA